MACNGHHLLCKGMEGKDQLRRLGQAQMLDGQSRSKDYLEWKRVFSIIMNNENVGMRPKTYAHYRSRMMPSNDASFTPNCASFNKAMIEFSFGDLDNSGRLNRHEFALLMSHLFMVPDERSLQIDERRELPQNPRPPTNENLGSFPIPNDAVVDGFICCEELKPKTDWRGSLVKRGHNAFKVAQEIANRAARLSDEKDPLLKLLMFGKVKTRADAVERMIELCDEVLRIIKEQPVLVQCCEPCKVFGDIHGQFSDLLLLFNKFGFPSTTGGDIETCSYIFNGDWVDRGPHQLEVLVLLFSLKILYPARVWLLRGNHEFKSMNEKYGFKKQVSERLIDPQMAEMVYNKMHSVFSWLPLSAVVANSILVLHGGIGDGHWGLMDLANIERPIQDEDEQGKPIELPDIVVQTLWSDPIMSDNTSYALARGVHPSPRGPGVVQFGANITEAFCKRENIQMILRSHQYCLYYGCDYNWKCCDLRSCLLLLIVKRTCRLVQSGICFMHGGRLATVFSARNYCKVHKNDAGMALLSKDEMGLVRLRFKGVRAE